MSTEDQLPTRAIRLGLNDLTFGLIASAIALVGAVLWSAHSPTVEKTDFSLTYVGAQIVHEGLGSRLYDIDLQKQVRNSLFPHPNPLFFEHPPFEALLLSPLAALPFRTAYLLWGLFNAAVWLLLIVVMRQMLPTPREDLGYVVLWLLFTPAGVTLYQGQSSLILLALYCGTFVLLRQTKDFVAGAAIGLGLFKFQFVIPFVLIFFFRKQWRFLAGFSVSAIVLGALSLFATGWSGVVSYIRFLLAIGTHPQNLSYGSAVDMPTIHGFIYALLGTRISPLQLTFTVFLLSVALLVFIALHWRTTHRHTEDRLMFAAAVAASLLTGLHMFTHDFSPLLLAAFIAAASLRSLSHTVLRGILLFTLLVFWLPPTYFFLVGLHKLYLMCPVLLLFVFCVIASASQIRKQLSQENSRLELIRS
jgi:hypothetical protein